MPDHDVTTFGRQIVWLLRNPELRQRLGTNALQLAKSDFNWDMLSIMIEQIYTAMLGNNVEPRQLHPWKLS